MKNSLINKDNNKQVELKVSQIYSTLRSKSELDSRATFLLLTSLVLLGLSLTSKKPDTVQILGFTLQADSWLILAVPLVLVVVYAIIDLAIAWYIELRYFNHAIYFPIIEINRDIHNIQKRIKSRYDNYKKESDQILSKREEIMEWYRLENRAIDLQVKILMTSSTGDFEESFLKLMEEKNELIKRLDVRLVDEGVKAFDEKIKDYIENKFFKGVKDDQVVMIERLASTLKRVLLFKRLKLALGFYVPLIVAVISLISMTASVAESF